MKTELGIPKKLGHIWIGPKPPPTEWMGTWKNKHKDWEYTLYDNHFLSSYQFKTKVLINDYLRRRLYCGVADLMRYEILYNFGGLLAEADSICYHNTKELFTEECAYTVYENEKVRGTLVSPIVACEPKNEFVGTLIEELCQLKKSDLDEPWRTTGNLFVAKMIEKYEPNVHIFPSHYFIPVHYTGIVYEGHDKIYAKQLFGSTYNSSYKEKRLPFIARKMDKLKNKKIQKGNEDLYKFFNEKRVELFNIDFSNNHKVTKTHF